MLTLKYSLLFFFLITFGALHSKTQDDSFMEKVSTKSANITDYRYKDTIPSECSLVRLENGKIVFMTKQSGEMKPFFIKAIETGFWDTRYEENVDYNSVFSDMVDIGANVAYVMIHWDDIEIKDNCFNFSFTDKIESIARKNGIKIKWVLFLHAQYNGVPTPDCTNSWTFHLDDRDSCNYTMQWPKQNGKIYKNIKTLVDNGGIRPLHVYGHKDIFYRIIRMLKKLASHYKESDTVIGVQIGNEEGFSFLDESDYNPVTAGLYEEWKVKTNKCDYAQFKREAMNWWWKQFTTAFHEIDPYKILSTNLDAGQAEAGDKNRVEMTGTSASFYKEGNLDVIGTMLYKQWGYDALLGLDERYNEHSYNFSLPILIPSEIGIGNFNKPEDFNSFVIHTLERGAQGFGVYCYGEVRKELPDSVSARKVLKNMFANISNNEHLIYSGLPGPGDVQCTVSEAGLKVSHLNSEKEGTLAMIYKPILVEEENKISSGDIVIHLLAKVSGKYSIKIYQSGRIIKNEDIIITKDRPTSILLEESKYIDPIFVNISMKK